MAESIETVTISIETFKRLNEESERWRVFEEANHLMIVDFNTRLSGTFRTTKLECINSARSPLWNKKAEGALTCPVCGKRCCDCGPGYKPSSPPAHDAATG